MKFIFYVFILIVTHSCLYAQDTIKHFNTPDTGKQPVKIAHEAMFPGGFDAWHNYIAKGIDKKTPKKHHAPVGEYKVTVSFFIDMRGKIINIRVLQDPGYGTAEDVLRVMQNAPLWIPAFQNGHNVMELQKQTVTYEVA